MCIYVYMYICIHITIFQQYMYMYITLKYYISYIGLLILTIDILILNNTALRNNVLY